MNEEKKKILEKLKQDKKILIKIKKKHGKEYELIEQKDKNKKK